MGLKQVKNRSKPSFLPTCHFGSKNTSKTRLATSKTRLNRSKNSQNGRNHGFGIHMYGQNGPKSMFWA
jgi:hypothetical protein